MSEILPPTALVEAIADLWRLAPPGPNKFFSSTPFVQLRECCQKLYPNAGSTGSLNFALSTALRALGMPIWIPAGEPNLALPLAVAAERLDRAFRRTEAKRIHLCPLDLADDLPTLRFGPNRIQRITATELESIVDPLRLKRINPSWTFDAKRFSEFNWLIVDEVVRLDREPGARATPLLFVNLSEDFGRIEPHPERFPTAVEAALFGVLLMPWEEWSEMAGVDWRGFRIPWVYTVDDDLFVRPLPPPSPKTLSWEPDIYTDGNGDEVEVNRPTHLPLADSISTDASGYLNDSTWSTLVTARQSPLFETPIAHFLVRAFLAEGIDEFLAHITVIEAALGMRSDFGGKGHPKPARHKSLRATDRVAGRVSGLLGAKAANVAYCNLFDIRSEFLHGRAMKPISSTDRNLARSLGRSVVNALVAAAPNQPKGQSREVYLEELLEKGLALR